MSKTENSDLTAEKDAPPMEMIRTDCADNTAIIIAVKSTNVMWEDPLAPVEVAKEVLNAQFENKYLIEAKIDTNVLGEKEIDNPDIYIKETTDIITHVPAHVSVKDVNVTQVKAQNYAESEEVLQPKFINEEKVDTSKQNARDNIAAYISRLEAEVRPALMYEERNRVIANQENQINALNNQVASLKEVISVTRDLLEIRNIEVKQLQISKIVDNTAHITDFESTSNHIAPYATLTN
ncbi:hypothetical protein G5I_06140 [Acromyrmex echinatior]|uniref:Uncharacterized protein n=1 Tax=Acromyrmex echinatior TaxID=103372 RepID=F4WK88_ACREC|nr:hypothetical protein G5I_06140 [Acromyrmex echinatior]